MATAGYEMRYVCHADLLSDSDLQTDKVSHGQWLAGGSRTRRLRRWIRDVGATIRFMRLMRSQCPNLVYINNLTGFSAACAAKLLGIPVIWHIRELFVDAGGEMHDPLGGRRAVRWALRCLADHVVVVSEAVRRSVLGKGQWEHVSVIPNAVGWEYFDCDLARVEARRRLGLPEEMIIIGVPGTLRPVKGHLFFLAAAARLAAEWPDARFAISGDGEEKYKVKLREEVERLGLQERVIFTGTVNDMRDFYRASDIACVPSRSESFGRTVIEAFAIGTPVVTTAVGGLAETIDDERNGLLVNYGDEEGLAAALRRLIDDAGLRERLRAEGLKDARELYHESVYQRRVLDVVESVMKRRGMLKDQVAVSA